MNVVAFNNPAQDRRERHLLAYNKVVAGYGELIKEKQAEGWEAFFTTFTFRYVPQGRKNQSTLVALMRDRIEFFYSMLLSRLYRKPSSPSYDGKLPILIAFPDKPVYKNQLKKILSTEFNSGIHWHGILLIAPADQAFRRTNESVVDFLNNSKSIFLNLHNEKQKDILQNIDYRAGGVDANTIDYAAKSIKYGRFSFASTLVLPKAKSEAKNDRKSSNF